MRACQWATLFVYFVSKKQECAGASAGTSAGGFIPCLARGIVCKARMKPGCVCAPVGASAGALIRCLSSRSLCARVCGCVSRCARGCCGGVAASEPSAALGNMSEGRPGRARGRGPSWAGPSDAAAAEDAPAFDRLGLRATERERGRGGFRGGTGRGRRGREGERSSHRGTIAPAQAPRGAAAPARLESSLTHSLTHCDSLTRSRSLPPPFPGPFPPSRHVMSVAQFVDRSLTSGYAAFDRPQAWPFMPRLTLSQINFVKNTT